MPSMSFKEINNVEGDMLYFFAISPFLNPLETLEIMFFYIAKKNCFLVFVRAITYKDKER